MVLDEASISEFSLTPEPQGATVMEVEVRRFGTADYELWSVGARGAVPTQLVDDFPNGQTFNLTPARPGKSVT